MSTTTTAAPSAARLGPTRTPIVAAMAAARSVGFRRPASPHDPAFSSVNGGVAEFRALAKAIRKQSHWRIATGLDLVADSIHATGLAMAEPPMSSARVMYLEDAAALSDAAMRLL